MMEAATILALERHSRPIPFIVDYQELEPVPVILLLMKKAVTISLKIHHHHHRKDQSDDP
jgi:hypothetical protein